MTDTNKDFPKYVGESVRKRLAELELSQYRFLQCFNGITHPTLTRILRGAGSTNISTLADICNELGLEITIKPKKDGIDYKKKFAH